MREHFLSAFVRQTWPDKCTDKLIKIALLPDAKASRYWDQWRDTYRIEDCSWPQHKLLVLISQRLPKIAPDCPDARHIEGLAKANWTKSKLRLHHAGSVIDRLQTAGIGVMLLKGAVSEALSQPHESRRVTSDLDLMVRREHLEATFDLLAEQGLVHRNNAASALDRCSYHPGVNISDPSGKLDIDVHHQPVHFPFISGATVNRIWQDARPAKFFNRQVLVPSAPDHLAFTVVQGMRRFVPSHLNSGLWAVELARWAAQGKPDWPGVVASAVSVKGALALYAALCYVREELDAEVPESVLDQLLDEKLGLGQYVSFFAQAPSVGVTGKMMLPLREAVLLLNQQAFHRSARSSKAD